MSFLSNPHLDPTTSHIETDRCVLVPFTSLELDSRRFCDDINQSYGYRQFTPQLSRRYLRNGVRATRGRVGYFVYILLKGDTKVRWTLDVSFVKETPNIGIWIDRDIQGQWYGSETYAAMLEWVRRNTVLKTIQHTLDPINTRSRWLAEKFGGVLQQGITEKGYEIYHIPL